MINKSPLCLLKGAVVPRTVKQEEYTAKRNQILEAALRLIYTRGYERMTIQDILNEVGISSGAFYHYFPSKPAVLEGFIERMQEESEKSLLPMFHDPHLSALEKLQGFFDTLDRLRIAQKDSIVKLFHVWYADDNAIVRQKVDAAIVEQRAPLIAGVVRQGLQEGVFTTAHPDQAGEVILSLLQGMGNSHMKLFLALDQGADEQHCIENVIAVHAAYMDAVERVLGAPPNSLYRTDAAAVKVWVAALRGENYEQK